MADNRHVQTQLLDLEKAQDAMDNAVTFAQRWPQQKFNELLLRRALRIREAAEAVALACLPKNWKREKREASRKAQKAEWIRLQVHETARP
jgi:hypothetical protein